MKKKISIVLVLAFLIGLNPGVARARLVACVGDSITYGWGISNRNYTYPVQLGRILRQFDRKWETQNFGVSGATLLENTNKPYVVQNAYNQALASEPEVVVIMLGTNDTARASTSTIEHDFIPDYLALIDAFAQLPSQPRIFVCYPPPILGGGYGSNTTLRDVIIPLIERLPTYRDVEVIDMYAPLEECDHLFISPGYLHPNAEGAMVMAEVVASVILGFRFSPDFNGDGIVDSADMCIMVDYWHTDEPSCDIAPPPLGDGIVDVQDLIAFSEYLFVEVEVYDSTLVGHWELDETEGDTAYDSTRNRDGHVYGEPLWQPEAGMVGGALEFDGIDDYVNIPSFTSTEDSSLSVFAWIKGSMTGQVIISQKGRSDWLLADTTEGSLMTDLQFLDRSGVPLYSHAVITDGNWHRVGLVWDGSNRILYVDDVEVVSDTCDKGRLSGRLQIGAGMNRDPGTYWSGLIDDVRIYNRVIIP